MPSTAFLKQIKAMLDEEQVKLERELAKYAKPNPHNSSDVANYDTKFPQFGDKEDENAAEVAEYAANMSIEEDLEKSLRDVKIALDRLAKGQYGTCKYCKKPIDEKRLLARPTSSACVDCKKAITQEA